MKLPRGVGSLGWSWKMGERTCDRRMPVSVMTIPLELDSCTFAAQQTLKTHNISKCTPSTDLETPPGDPTWRPHLDVLPQGPTHLEALRAVERGLGPGG
jgi:hypothetical protein